MNHDVSQYGIKIFLLMRIKISVLITSLSGGGAERVISYLLNYFHSNKIDVILVLFTNKISYLIPPVEKYIMDLDSKNDSGIKKIISLPRLAIKYGNICKQNNITHSISFLTRPNYVNVLSKKLSKGRYKTIISERAFPSLQYGYGDFKSLVNRLLIRTLYRDADLTISNSKGNGNDLIQNFRVSNSKLTVIYNPVEIKKVRATEPISNFFNESFFNFVSVGRLIESKNFELIIKATSRFERARLYILGEGPHRKVLEEMISNYSLQDKVFLLGFQTNPYQYLKGADAFVMASMHEGFPNVLLEAMACNLPVVSTNCKSGPDEILELNQPNENQIMRAKYGLLVPLDNLDLMTKAMELIQDSSIATKFINKYSVKLKEFEMEQIMQSYFTSIISK